MKPNEQILIHQCSHEPVIISLDHGRRIGVRCDIISNFEPYALGLFLQLITDTPEDAQTMIECCEENNPAQLSKALDELQERGHVFRKQIAGQWHYLIQAEPMQTEDAIGHFERIERGGAK